MKFQKTALNIAMIMALGMGVTACGSGGDDNGGGSNNNGGNIPSDVVVEEKVVLTVITQDGLGEPLGGQRVCLDLNNSKSCENDEPSFRSSNLVI